MQTRLLVLLVIGLAALAASCGSSDSAAVAPPQPSPTPPPPAVGLATGPATCISGLAADFNCSGIDLRRRVANGDMGGGEGNDIWGWVDPLNNEEYALMGLTTGIAFVNVTDPDNPVVVGTLPTETIETPWRDIKVYQDHAYVIADRAESHGIQVFDLTRLRGVAPPQVFTADVVYDGITSAHNIAINEDTGFLYAVGSNTCAKGLHMVDIRTPDKPMFAGCYSDQHLHDTQCIVYQGPDSDYLGREICFNSAFTNTADNLPIGTHILGIVDVTDKADAVTVFERDYPDAGYAHQGWITDDHRFFLLGDELDESELGFPTRTLIFDVSDLDAPVFVSAYEAATSSIDHNLYVLGNRVYQANYTSGVRVLEFSDLANSVINEVAFFDTFPAGDSAVFDGTWSVYPYLPSGNIIASDIANGLFILTPR
ncbi:MAG: choice-of-anchor B family protein [Gammaproteobacteria bacterium]|nr:choice-of-anchor B family protein [Gammaproteobacteria bacterium]